MMPIGFSLLLFLMAALSHQTFSSAPRSSHFIGTIVGSDTAKIPKAKVLIENGKQKWRLECDDRGEFKIDLPPGNYQFTISAAHFKKHIETNFCIGSGAKISYEFRLEPGECNGCDWIISDAPPNKALQLTAR